MTGGRIAPGATLAVAAMLGLAACATTSGRDDVPAVLTTPTAESRAELERILSGALHGAAITIADDALTRDGTLIIERARPRTAGGVPLDGRETGRPEHFRLVKAGSRCVLVHARTGRRWTLKAASCAPAARPRARRRGLSSLVLAPPRSAELPAGTRARIVASIESLEREWFRVYETRDLAVLRRLIADDFVATLADGTVRGKDAHIAAYKADFESLASVTNSELRVTVFTPDVSVAIGLYTASDRESGERKRYRYTDTWLRRKGRWQCVATHENRVD